MAPRSLWTALGLGLALCLPVLGCNGAVESNSEQSSGGASAGAAASGGTVAGAGAAEGDSPTSNGGEADGGVGSGGQHSGGSGGALEMATGGAGGGAGESDYRPTRTDVSFSGDDRLSEGGSVETANGFGWDTCLTKNPGLSLQQEEAAQGDWFLEFRPTGPGPTSSEGAPAQVAFFGDEPFEAGVPLFVYFEIRNLSEDPPQGELSLAPVDFCRLSEAETTIPLEALEPGPTWETRCVELIPAEEQPWLGIWLTGEDFAIGIDAVRFGPPCK